MLTLRQYLIRSLIALFTITLLLSGIVSYFTIKDNSIKRYEIELETHIKLIELQFPSLETIDLFAKAIKEQTHIRFTLINQEGVVLAESDKEHEKMDNHSRREEIIKAQKEDFGHAIRYSDSLKSNFLYVAHRFTQGDQTFFIRLATNIDTIMHHFYDLWLKITLIFTLSLFVSLYGAYTLSKAVRKEVDRIIINLQQIADKEYKITRFSHFSVEFFDIANYLKKVATKLEKRAKQKRKYTAKIKLISQQRSDIISAISHEFKNPIASIMGYAQTLLDDPTANAQIKERFLGKIVHNGQKISTMIDRLTLTTKFENGDFQLQKTTFDADKMLLEVVQNFKERYPNRTFIVQTLPYTITADRTMMEIVISNLLDNALKYSQESIHVSLENACLHIKDTGIGIKTEDIEKVTQKFYRSNTHSWDNSMGLGLALVSYILKLHDTHLDIQSTLGVGSDFSFKLP